MSYSVSENDLKKTRRTKVDEPVYISKDLKRFFQFTEKLLMTGRNR